MKKIINFYYKRNSVPHSKYKVIQSLKKFLEDKEELYYKISTSTAVIFTIVRAFCDKYGWKLVAFYEDMELDIYPHMGIIKWLKCPDFEIVDDCLEILLTSKDD